MTVYILVRGTIAITGAGAHDVAKEKDERDKGVPFKEKKVVMHITLDMKVILMNNRLKLNTTKFFSKYLSWLLFILYIIST